LSCTTRSEPKIVHILGLVGRDTLVRKTSTVSTGEIITSEDRMNFRNILVTTDFSAASEAAFEVAAYEAKNSLAQITLLTIVQDWVVPPELYSAIPYPERIDEYRDTVRADAQERLTGLLDKFHGQSVKPVVIVSSRSVPVEIAEYAAAQGSDLIVLASRGKGVFEHIFLGSVLEKLLSIAPCPVLVIPVKKRQQEEKK
jgi:nucleotide-binding universal stress UspA family protein